MDKLRAVFRTWVDWWWQGMTIHARQVCRDESEILERIRDGGRR
ncbi:hypothetical protein [Chromobacterium sinusclupearum]|nr:hypothetical protein [Chromobacterium sinusclupearum]